MATAPSVVDSSSTRAQLFGASARARAPERAPLVIHYEHPQWFDRLFAELDRRGVLYERSFAPHHAFDPSARGGRRRVVFNRMSPSAYRRGAGTGLFHTLAWLGHLERTGDRVINGARAFGHELSKALQLSVLATLGLPAPASRVLHRVEDVAAAAEGLRFPVVVKPNVGGSGAGIVRFDTLDALRTAAADGRLDFGFDHVGLVQEFLPARGDAIVRVECVGGRYLYGIKVGLAGRTFDLCPADLCEVPPDASIDGICLADTKSRALQVEAFEPPPHVVHAVEKILSAMSIDVGGVEYLVDDRDGQISFYDVNALSNFVADAPAVLGFDPHVDLVDYLLSQLEPT